MRTAVKCTSKTQFTRSEEDSFSIQSDRGILRVTEQRLTSSKIMKIFSLFINIFITSLSEDVPFQEKKCEKRVSKKFPLQMFI